MTTSDQTEGRLPWLSSFSRYLNGKRTNEDEGLYNRSKWSTMNISAGDCVWEGGERCWWCASVVILSAGAELLISIQGYPSTQGQPLLTLLHTQHPGVGKNSCCRHSYSHNALLKSLAGGKRCMQQKCNTSVTLAKVTGCSTYCTNKPERWRKMCSGNEYFQFHSYSYTQPRSIRTEVFRFGIGLFLFYVVHDVGLFVRIMECYFNQNVPFTMPQSRSRPTKCKKLCAKNFYY